MQFPILLIVSMIRDEEVNTDSFFRIYQEHFHPEEQGTAGDA